MLMFGLRLSDLNKETTYLLTYLLCWDTNVYILVAVTVLELLVLKHDDNNNNPLYYG